MEKIGPMMISPGKAPLFHQPKTLIVCVRFSRGGKRQKKIAGPARPGRNVRGTRRRLPTVVKAAKGQTYTQMETVPTTPTQTTFQPGIMNWLMPMAALVLGALLYNPVRARFGISVIDNAEESDEVSYRRAVARTRQSIYINRSIGFMRTNAPARVMVELQRALKENAICRTELLVAQHSQEELQGLYRMHLRNAEVPPEYATLLQLREMLGISAETATKIENEIDKTDSFVI